MLAELLKSGTVYHHADPYEVSAYVRSHIGNHTLDMRRCRGSSATLRHKNFGVLGLSEITYGGHVLVCSSGLDQTYHLQVVTEGRCSVRYGNTNIDLTPGQATLINPREVVTLDYSPDCVKMIVKLPSAMLNECSAEQFGHTPSGGVRFGTSSFVLERDSPFFRMLELVYLEADQQETFNQSVSSPMALILATKLFQLFPHNVTRCRQHADDAYFFSVIDDYIDANAKNEISAEHLAALGGMSLRTLYDRFKVAKGIAPAAYIKQRKLHKVNRQLRNGLGPVPSITGVVLDYGFAHLGRFSSEYKDLFGELPSETLRQRLLRSGA